MSTINRKVTIRAVFHQTTLSFPLRLTFLPAPLTNCPAPRIMAHFPACLTLLSVGSTHCPICLVNTPAPQTQLPQGSSTGVCKEKKQEGVKGKEEKGVGETGEEEVKKAVEARQAPGQRMIVLETVSLTHQIYQGKV